MEQRPSKHDTLTQFWVNVARRLRRQPNIHPEWVSMYRVCLATVPRPYQEVTRGYNKHASDWLTMN